MRRSLSLISCVLLFLGLTGLTYSLHFAYHGQTESNPARAEIAEGMKAIYEYRMKDADQLSSTLIKKYPKVPAARLLRANYLWNLVIGGQNNEKNRQGIFDEIHATEALLHQTEQKEKNEDLFASISMKVMKARVHGFRGSQFKAFSELHSAVGDVRQSFGKENEFSYFRLSTGLYLFYRSYARERYPFTAPYLMLLPNGDKKRGMQMLEDGFLNGDPYLSCESGYFLVKIKTDMKDYRGALEKAMVLHKKYPNNLLFAHFVVWLGVNTTNRTLAENTYKEVLLIDPVKAGYVSGQKEYFLVRMRQVLDGEKINL